MEAPENGHSGTGASLPKKAFGLITQLKCICPSACSVGNEHEILEEENYGIVAIPKTWWDDWHHWNGAMDGGKLLGRNTQGMRGGGVVLYMNDGVF